MKTRHCNKTRIQNATPKARGAALLGCFVFLFVGTLRGEERLLKEYIYLDGRLLAVERQVVTVIAQKSPEAKDQDSGLELAALDRPLLPSVSGIQIPPLPESLMNHAIAEILDGEGKTYALAGGERPQEGGQSDD